MKHTILNEFDQKDNFYIRIREGKAAEIYYNGIEPFKIRNNKISDFNTSLFVFNSTNIRNHKNNLISCLKNNREKFYDQFELNAIYLKKGTYGKSHEEEMKIALKEVGAVLENGKYKIDGMNVNIEDEYSILKKIWVDYKRGISNLFQGIDLDWNKKLKKIEVDDIKKFVPKLVKDYFEYTRPEVERYYQHLFLLDKDEIGFRKEKMFFNNSVKPFEEEYYIDEINKDGRIDCIFYKEDGTYITDIYLVEIKVDTKVIGGSNGLHKHLLDILHINDRNKDFFETLIKRINYRNKVLYDKEELKVAENLEKHFFIVIGRNNSSLKEIENSIIDLSDEKSTIYKNVKSKISNKYKSEVEPLSKTYEKCSKDVEVKLFVDQNEWNVSDNFEPDYEDFTKWLKDEK